MKYGLPIPDRIENAPSILPGLELYYLAFLALNSSRSVGFGIGPIPWLAIEQYCRLMELDSEQTENMHSHIAAMDLVYIKHHSKKK